MALVTVSTLKNTHCMRFSWDESHDHAAAQNLPQVRDSKEAIVLWAQILYAQNKRVPPMCRVSVVEMNPGGAVTQSFAEYTTPEVPYNVALAAINAYFAKQNKTEENKP